jgi:mono/diheme cytochrome c family protein
MKADEKHDYLEGYAEKKRSGVPFFPDAIARDVVASAIVIGVLAVIAGVFGSPLEAPAEPGDTNYAPRPEWYFLFLFQFLKYVPGDFEAVGVIGIPIVLIGLLVALPFLDRSSSRHPRNRPGVIWTTVAVLGGVGLLTTVALADAPAVSEVVALTADDLLATGQEVFVSNCAVCHGQFGEGGPDPVQAGDVIAPISTAQYLTTHGDETIRSIISNGQPTLGMAPFALSSGGPLRESDIDAVVAFVRSWEQDPPVVLPPSVAVGSGVTTGEGIFTGVCSQCHGADGSGGIGPSFVDPVFHAAITDAELFDAINLGHPATSMIGWGDVLTSRQIETLVVFIRELGGITVAPEEPEEPEEPAPSALSFATDVAPIFEGACSMCHGAAGGWDASTWETAIGSGANGPAVIPGDPDNSVLIQKLLGTTSFGTIMPPAGSLSDAEIATVVEWIRTGAPR